MRKDILASLTPGAREALITNGFAGTATGLGARKSRRDFLKVSGALVVGFSLAESRRADAQFVGTGPGAPPAGQVDSWIAIGADGGVTASRARKSWVRAFHRADPTRGRRTQRASSAA